MFISKEKVTKMTQDIYFSHNKISELLNRVNELEMFMNDCIIWFNVIDKRLKLLGKKKSNKK